MGEKPAPSLWHYSSLACVQTLWTPYVCADMYEVTVWHFKRLISYAEILWYFALKIFPSWINSYIISIILKYDDIPKREHQKMTLLMTKDTGQRSGPSTSCCTSPQDVELVQQAGGAPVEDDRRAAVVPGRCTDTWLIQTGLARPVLLWVQPPVGVISPWRRGGLLRLGLGLRVEGRTPGPGVGVSLWFTVLWGADVRLGVLAALLHGAVGGSSSSSSCGSCLQGFREQAGYFAPGFLTVVLQQTIILGALLALVVGSVVARYGGQVAVLGPHSWRQRVEAELGLHSLAVLLQELVDGQGGLFDQHPTLVAQSWIHKAALTLLYQGVELWGLNRETRHAVSLHSLIRHRYLKCTITMELL